jgi:hypothetical protein
MMPSRCSLESDRRGVCVRVAGASGDLRRMTERLSLADSPPLVTADRQFLTIDFARPVLGPGDHRTTWLLSDPQHPRVRPVLLHRPAWISTPLELSRPDPPSAPRSRSCVAGSSASQRSPSLPAAATPPVIGSRLHIKCMEASNQEVVSSIHTRSRSNHPAKLCSTPRTRDDTKVVPS